MPEESMNIYKTARRAAGITQEAAAEQLGISVESVRAYLGRTEIAESLSKIALTDIVVVVLTYAGKALVEQLSKYNKWPDKPAQKEEDNV